jgi:DNA-binding MarR family transcriptional regulator
MSFALGPRDQRQLSALRAALMPLQEQLSLAHLVSLLTIAAEPGLSVKDLADRTGTPQASASRYVSVLLGRYSTTGEKPIVPLITQEISADDPRRRALYLSDHGREVVMTLLGSLQTDLSRKEASSQ